ncbi:membrane protein [Rhodopirellula sallentina SM41]|uniref:Membrane protein n=1 Tax=Rhodopirellula sallentina SM41 TaxID=1263870 RepID=M5U8R4_9BACT|nr:membrane protein [Rhodopirellula sallentina SM41]
MFGQTIFILTGFLFYGPFGHIVAMFAGRWCLAIVFCAVKYHVLLMFLRVGGIGPWS